MKIRPKINQITSGEAFDQWYWSKEELVHFCQQNEIPSQARKNELRRRVTEFLDTGKVTIEPTIKESNFDWSTEVLSDDTIITDSVKFGRNLRNYMKARVGDRFSFSNSLMNWFKENVGSTLNEAVEYWHELEHKKANGYRLDMSDFNVMNKYLEDFLTDNPELSRNQAMQCWQIKKYHPAPKGLVKYQPADLGLM